MLRCRAPGCENEVVQASERGRRAVYCSPGCRPSAYKPARQDKAHSLVGFGVEVGNQPAEDGARPYGRVFHVMLSSGNRSVVVADELSRPSAEHLAMRLRKFFGTGADVVA